MPDEATATQMTAAKTKAVVVVVVFVFVELTMVRSIRRRTVIVAGYARAAPPPPSTTDGCPEHANTVRHSATPSVRSPQLFHER